MKRFAYKIVILSIALIMIAGGAFAQTNSISDLKDTFSTFSGDIAQALPHAASTGLTWSDAKVRGFPHFGVGVSLGTVMVPKDAFVDLADSLTIDLPSDITDSELGVPFPAYAVDARLGLPILPFDIGAKLGMLTPEMSENFGGDISADYMLAGFELRYPILKGGLAMPSLSISAGYNYLSGGINAKVGNAGVISDSIDLSTLISGASIGFSDPDVRFAWKTNALDFKLQASKGLLIFTPYVGGGYTYGWSQAGGGVASNISFSGASEEDIVDALEAADYTFELEDDSFTLLSKASGGSLRAFGGMSINLLILKLDLNGQYNFTTGSLGGGINARIQI